MSDVRPQDILLRVGGLTLKRYNCVAVFGASRLEVPITFTRADATSCATEIDRDGIIHTAAANVLRTEWVDLDGDGIREMPGFSIEGSRVNSSLWASDASNAAWIKTTATALKNATGPDGVASSASTITATASGGFAWIPG